MVELREVVPSDVRQMVAIQREITKKKVSPAWRRMVEHHLEGNPGMGFVAVRDGKVVGFAIGEVKGAGFGLTQSGWIQIVGVHPQAMGEGIGKAMIERLFEAFRKRKITDIHTAVRWDAVDMLSFFKSVGFGRSDFINLVRRL